MKKKFKNKEELLKHRNALKESGQKDSDDDYDTEFYDDDKSESKTEQFIESVSMYFKNRRESKQQAAAQKSEIIPKSQESTKEEISQAESNVEKQKPVEDTTPLETFESKKSNKITESNEIFNGLINSLERSISKLKNDIANLSNLAEKDEKIKAHLSVLISNLESLEKSQTDIKTVQDSKSMYALNKEMFARILIVQELVNKNQQLNPSDIQGIFDSLVSSIKEYLEKIKKSHESLNKYMKDVVGFSDDEIETIQKSVETLTTELSTYSTTVQSISKELETLSQTSETTKKTVEETSSTINKSTIDTVEKVDNMLYRQQTHLQDFVSSKITSIVDELNETTYGLKKFTKDENEKLKKELLKAISRIQSGGGLIPDLPDSPKKAQPEKVPPEKLKGDSAKTSSESTAKGSTNAAEAVEKSAAKGAAKTGVSFLGKATTALSVGVGAYEMYNTMTDKSLSVSEKTDKGVGTAVGTAAGVGGSVAGAAIGQVLIPIPVVGALIGGAVGGMASNIVGDEVGQFASKKLGLGKASEYVNEHAYSGIDAVSSLWGGDDASNQRKIESRSVIDLFNKKMKTNEIVSDFLLKKMAEYKLPFNKEDVEKHNEEVKKHDSELAKRQEPPKPIEIPKPVESAKPVEITPIIPPVPVTKDLVTTPISTISKIPEPVFQSTPVAQTPAQIKTNLSVPAIATVAAVSSLETTKEPKAISTIESSKPIVDKKLVENKSNIESLSSGLQVANSLVDTLTKKLKELPNSFAIQKPTEKIDDKSQKSPISSFEPMQKSSQKIQNVNVSLKDLKQPNAFGDTPLSLLSAGYDPSAIVFKEAYQPEIEEDDNEDDVDLKLAKNLSTSSKKTNKAATQDPDTKLILESIDLVGKSVEESATTFLSSQEDVEKTLAEKLANIFSPATSQVSSSVNSMWSSIKNVTENMWNTTKTTAPETKKKIETVANTVSTTPAVQAAGGTVNTVVNKAKDLINAATSSNPGISGSGNKIAKVIESGAGFNIVQRADGTKEKQVGSRNWRNNNPGNIEFGDFAKKYGAIDSDGRFAIFPSYEAGREAKSALIFEGKNYKDKTLSEAIMRYAPPSENDSERYKQIVLDAVGGEDKKMSTYTKKERSAILSAMEKHEGFRAGKVGKVDDAGNVGKLETATDPRTATASASTDNSNISNTPELSASSTVSSSSPMSGGGGTLATPTNSTAPVSMGQPPDITKTPDLSNKSDTTGISNAVSADGVKVQSGVNVEGLQPAVKKNLYAMATEYKQLTGKPLTVTSAFRSIEKQQELYDKLGPKGAAKPGRSMHNFGYAVDIATVDANKLQELGLLDKYNFARPLLKGKGKVKPEPWHVEPKGIQGEYAAIRAGADLNEKINGTSSAEGGTGTALTSSESAIASSEKTGSSEKEDKTAVSTPVSNSAGLGAQAVNSEIKSEIADKSKDANILSNSQTSVSNNSIQNNETTANNSTVNNISKTSTLDITAADIEHVSVIPNTAVNKDQIMSSNIAQSGADSAQAAVSGAVTMINNSSGGSSVNNVSQAPASPTLDYFDRKDATQQAMENLNILTLMTGSSNRG